MARVLLEGVTKRFGSVTAVHELSLEIHDQEFLVLLGPSGCGKSTLLRMIAGLEEPTEGSVVIGDRVVNGVPPKNRDIAMVFQSYALYPHKSARQNIEFPLKTRGMPKDERAGLVDETAATLGLTELLDRRPGQMSGGQRQRVALARAIVRRPSVFLMDEPLSNLDAKLRVQTRAELIDLHHRLATTFVYVTHDQVEAMTMGSRVAIMLAGVLQQVGAPQEVYDLPANVFVAQFIGSPPMNVVRGRVIGSDGERSVVLPGGTVSLPTRLAHAAAAAGLDEVVVGVRPEHLTFAADGTGIEATVRVVESLGHERHVLCRLDAETNVTVRVPSDAPVPAEGDHVRLSTGAEHVHLFDPTSSARID